jgi:Skp family chaperone for outer membrane proteins
MLKRTLAAVFGVALSFTAVFANAAETLGFCYP